jgi:prepilin-type N-terminal cleavage/methylation domain-containing protein
VIRRTANTDGFSLIELLIAVAILGLIMSQMFLVLSTQKRAYVGSARTLDVQESARLVTDLIAFDTRVAGFMVPRYASVSSVDGDPGTAGDPTDTGTPDRLCLSDPDIFSIPRSDAAEDSIWNQVDTRFTGPTTDKNQQPRQTLTLNSLDVDGEAPFTDFRVGSGIILASERKTFCSVVEEILPGNRIKMRDDALNTFPLGPVAIPAIIYEVTREDGDPATGQLEQMSLTRNGTQLSTVIEDLQVEYWVDEDHPNCNGIMDLDEFPIHDLNDPTKTYTIDRTRLVRVTVVARGELEEDLPGGVEMSRYRRPAVANHAVGAPDGFPRRRFTTSVLPRNVLARVNPEKTARCRFIP